MPPIYRLPRPRGDGVSKNWGWHRAKELIEVIRNLYFISGELMPTAEEICTRFIDIQPTLLGSAKRPVTIPRPYICIEADGLNDHFTTAAGSEWLGKHADNDRFIPARIGIELLRAVKKYLRLQEA